MQVPFQGNRAAGDTMLRAIVESASQGMLAVNAEGTIQWANPMAERQFAYASGEMRGQSLLGLIPERVHEKHIAHMTAYFRDPKPRLMGQGMQLNARRQDGSEFPVEISLSHVVLPGSSLSVAFITDITQRNALQGERDRLYELSRDLMCSLSSDGIFKQVNPAFTRQLGWSEGELISRRFDEFVHPDDLEKSQAAFHVMLTSGEQLLGFENRVFCKDGSFRWLEWSAPPLSDHTIYVVGRDTTERKLADETREFLASIVQSSDDGIIGSDLSGKILSWNRGAERMFGYTAVEAVGRLIDILFPPDRKAEYLNSMVRVQRNEGIERFEATRARKDGTPLDVSVILSPIRNSVGVLVGVSAIYHDITERKQKEVDLRWAKEAAEAASQIKSEFLANMSHEIRTPMNGIIGMTEVLLDTDPTDEQRGYLGVVKTSAESLLAIVNEILDISKIEAHKLSLNLQDFSLRDSLAATIQALVVPAQQKGLALTCSVQPAVSELVRGDETRLRQVLINLLGNAIKFTAAGEVELTVETLPENSGSLHFIVRDTGSGVPAGKQAMIFDAFTQADSSITRKFGGTGLGLAIASNLVELMGGRIWMESDGRSGSAFHFTARLEPVHLAFAKTVMESEVKPTSTERRHESRVAMHGLVRMRILRLTTPIFLEGQIVDLSGNGLKVRISRSLDESALIEVKFGTRMIVAEVRYCMPAGGNQFHAGLEIVYE